MSAAHKPKNQPHAIFFPLCRKISFIPLSSQQGGSKHKNAPGVVHFVPDVDSRRGAITCVAASSHGDGEWYFSLVFPCFSVFAYSRFR